jgi:hypothetical protein
MAPYLPALPTLEILSTAFRFTFALWPIIIIAPLERIRRGRYILPDMLVAWTILAALRIATLLLPQPTITINILREPDNTILFIAAGAALLGIHLILKYTRKP